MKPKKNKDKKPKEKVGISKKEIKAKIQEKVNLALTEFHVDSPSRKTRKTVKKLSGKVAGKIKTDLKKQNKKSKKEKETEDAV